jgi:hypothetical protein
VVVFEILAKALKYSEVFRGCCQRLQANTGLVERLGHERFVLNLGQLTINSMICPCKVHCE